MSKAGIEPQGREYTPGGEGDCLLVTWYNNAKENMASLKAAESGPERQGGDGSS